MGKYAFTGAILLVMLLFYLFSAGPMAGSPQQVSLISGGSARVGGGRATLWFAQPTDVYTGGRIASAAQVSLSCKGNETPITVLPGETTDAACGVRLRLLKMIEPGETSRVFRATFEITW